MANMSYCRFQNTALALDDCADAMEEILAGDGEGENDTAQLSRDEFEALVRMVRTVANITELLSDAGIEDLDSNKLREQLAGLFLGQD